jgi:hypothetical protein
VPLIGARMAEGEPRATRRTAATRRWQPWTLPQSGREDGSQCTNWESGDQSRQAPRCHPQ